MNFIRDIMLSEYYFYAGMASIINSSFMMRGRATTTALEKKNNSYE